MNCERINCLNEATNLLYRFKRPEEQVFTHHGNYSTLDVIEKRWICDEHLEVSKKDYPYVANTHLNF